MTGKPMNDKDTVVVPREAQDRRRTALIERLGTVADLACSTPLPGELGDVAYDLLRQAAAQIASDRLHIRRLLAAAPSTSVREEGVAEALERAAKVADLEGMAADTQMNAGAQGAAIAAARIATAIRALKPSTYKGGEE